MKMKFISFLLAALLGLSGCASKTDGSRAASTG